MPYQNVVVIINPASGKQEPVLNTLNDVFRQHDLPWSIRITHQFGMRLVLPVKLWTAARTWWWGMAVMGRRWKWPMG